MFYFKTKIIFYVEFIKINLLGKYPTVLHASVREINFLVIKYFVLLYVYHVNLLKTRICVMYVNSNRTKITSYTDNAKHEEF